MILLRQCVRLQKIGKKFNANVKVVEVPPGPPVMSTLVAEVYGPNDQERISIASQLKGIFSKTPDVVDVDWLIEDDHKEYQFDVDKEKAMLAGVTTQQVVQSIAMTLNGQDVSQFYQEKEHEQIGINLRLKEEERSSLNDLKKGEHLNSDRRDDRYW